MACIFCKIIAGELPCAKVYEDEQTLAFRDTAPAAPVHIIVVPKTHVASLAQAETLADSALAALTRACVRAAQAEGLAQNGYRVVSNIGKDAGQTIDHLHVHVLGGRALERMG